MPRARAARGATLRDVALRAGVSVMTVSNVVNQRLDLVQAETRARVEKAIAELSYRPRSVGRQLRLNRHFAVGMLIVDPLAAYLSDPFVSQIVAGFSTYVSERGLGCLLQGVRPEKFGETIFLQADRIDGLCVFLCGTDRERQTMLERLVAQGDSVVAIEDTLVGLHPDLCIVGQDDRGGAAAITTHLADRGARRFVVLRPTMNWPAVSERIEGTRRVLAARGLLDAMVCLSCGQGSAAEGRSALSRHIAAQGLPDAVLGTNDRLASGAIEAVRRTGATVPDDVIVGGFHSHDPGRGTKVDFPTVLSAAYQVGHAAGLALVERIDTGRFSASQVLLPVHLSTG